MNDINGESKDLQENNRGAQKGLKIQCIREENYLKELMINSHRIQRMQEFVRNLE